jgi:hypothetical protein
MGRGFESLLRYQPYQRLRLLRGPFHVATRCNMTSGISNGLQALTAAPCNTVATWSTGGCSPTGRPPKLCSGWWHVIDCRTGVEQAFRIEAAEVLPPPPRRPPGQPAAQDQVGDAIRPTLALIAMYDRRRDLRRAQA